MAAVGDGLGEQFARALAVQVGDDDVAAIRKPPAGVLEAPAEVEVAPATDAKAAHPLECSAADEQVRGHAAGVRPGLEMVAHPGAAA